MNFEGKKVGEVKELTEQFKKQNPDVKTAEELLEDLKWDSEDVQIAREEDC